MHNFACRYPAVWRDITANARIGEFFHDAQDVRAHLQRRVVKVKVKVTCALFLFHIPSVVR